MQVHFAPLGPRCDRLATCDVWASMALSLLRAASCIVPPRSRPFPLVSNWAKIRGHLRSGDTLLNSARAVGCPSRSDSHIAR